MDLQAEIADLRSANYSLLKENTNLQKTIQDQNLEIYNLKVLARTHTEEIGNLHKMMKQIQAGMNEMEIGFKMQIEELKEEIRTLRTKLELN